MNKKRKDNILKFAGLLSFFGMQRSIEVMRAIKNIDPKHYNKTLHYNILQIPINITIKDIRLALGLYFIWELRLGNE